MSDLENRMVRKFQNNVAISQMKEEYRMKRANAKNIMVVSMVGILCVLGSFVTVNAATDGKLAENVKHMIYKVYSGENLGVTVEIFSSDPDLEVKTYDVDASNILNENGLIEEGTYQYDTNEDGTITLKLK